VETEGEIGKRIKVTSPIRNNEEFQKHLVNFSLQGALI